MVNFILFGRLEVRLVQKRVEYFTEGGGFMMTSEVVTEPLRNIDELTGPCILVSEWSDD